jgi:predicted transcriptional regulator
MDNSSERNDMEPAQDSNHQELAQLTSDIVAAYVANNNVPSADLPGVIVAVHSALRGLDTEPAREPEKPVPMVPIKRSITPDYLISLEDGRRYKSLKRHLTGRGLTPAEYRDKWGLAKDYPMVAPNYAKQRSELARALGLGQQRRKRPQKEAPAETPPAAAEAAAAPRKRGRPKAAAKA